MGSRITFAVIATLVGVAVIGCGTNPPAQPPTTLTGNWSLAGTRTPATYPLLSATLLVSGNQIIGNASSAIQCNPTAELEGTFPLSGTIASDGTFQVSTPIMESASPASYQISISGNSPGRGSTQSWTGNYSITGSTPANSSIAACSYSHSATFTATPIAALTGIYSGPVGLVNQIGSNASLTLNVSQGQPTETTSGSIPIAVIPITASITVAGSACFASGTTGTAMLNRNNISGDHFDLYFTMDDGSTFLLSGNLSDPSAASVSLVGNVQGGVCNEDFVFTTLNRQ